MLVWAARRALRPPSRLQVARSAALHPLCLHPTPAPSHLATLAQPPDPDNRLLLELFDRPSSTSDNAGLTPTGLFLLPTLTHPQAFSALTDLTIQKAELITQRIVNAASSPDELRKVVKNLDRLSDTLCSLIDLAELVRNSHPDPAWIDRANDAYERTSEFMNILNTHVGLYEVLKIVLEDASLRERLSPEAYQTALIFWRDFEKSGINLRPEQRAKFVELSSEILVLGRQFLLEGGSPRPPVSIPSSEVKELKDRGLGSRLKLAKARDLQVYPGSVEAQIILSLAPSEEARRKVYLASNYSTPEQIEILHNLLRTRGELARLVGRDSYAHMTLEDKMAKNPANVTHFLNTLLEHTRPSASEAIHALRLRKRAHLGTSPLPTIQAWDRDFYCPPEAPSPPFPLPPLTPGTVFMALSRLFRHIYGISFRPAEVRPGEVWHSDVRKLEVVDEEHGVIGWIYADLFARPNKASGAAHYTVRCSRRTDDDDERGDYVNVEGSSVATLAGQWQEREASNRHRLKGVEGVYQLPIVVLLCEFTRPTLTRGAFALQWSEVLTLFHEMGHAMHSMIGRTEYQNVCGTRCATDFVELPSILMEHFLSSPQVLTLFSLNSSAVDLTHPAHHGEDPCTAIDTHTQILLSLLDQMYHSPESSAPSFDSTVAFRHLYDTRGVIQSVPGTSWQTQFGHLYGYGAMYYSYLFDRVIASRVWKKAFTPDPLGREMGEHYKSSVLRFGGGEDPWKMVSGLLCAPDLEAGDVEAMKEVGRWRIEDEVGIPSRH